MKVYIIYEDNYDGTLDKAVFSSRESAERILALYNQIYSDHKIVEFTVDELENASLKEYRTFEYCKIENRINLGNIHSSVCTEDFYISETPKTFYVSSALPLKQTLEKIKEAIPDVNDNTKVRYFVKYKERVTTVGEYFESLSTK